MWLFCITWPVLTCPGQAWLVSTLRGFSNHACPPPQPSLSHGLQTFRRSQLRYIAVMETRIKLSPLRIPCCLPITAHIEYGYLLISSNFARLEVSRGADITSTSFATLHQVSRPVSDLSSHGVSRY